MKDFFQYRESLTEAKGELTPAEKKKLDNWIEEVGEGAGPGLIGDDFDLGMFVDKRTYQSWLQKKILSFRRKEKLSPNEVKAAIKNADPSKHYSEYNDDCSGAVGSLWDVVDQDEWDYEYHYDAETDLLKPKGRELSSKKYGDDGVEYIEGRGKMPSVVYPPSDGWQSKSAMYCKSKIPVPKGKLDMALEYLTDNWE